MDQQQFNRFSKSHSKCSQSDVRIYNNMIWRLVDRGSRVKLIDCGLQYALDAVRSFCIVVVITGMIIGRIDILKIRNKLFGLIFVCTFFYKKNTYILIIKKNCNRLEIKLFL